MICVNYYYIMIYLNSYYMMNKRVRRGDDPTRGQMERLQQRLVRYNVGLSTNVGGPGPWTS